MKQYIAIITALLLVWPAYAASKKNKQPSFNNVAISYLDNSFQQYDALQKQIWANPELGFLETFSSSLLQKHLVENGFDIETGVAGMPTAFVATYGSGEPVIGILAEFDALPGLSQDTVPYRKPLVEGGNGHGCGHNLLGAGAFAAALGIKAYLEQNDVSGTVILYGCPGEEGGAAKAFMARDGLWKKLDAALTWHPEDVNEVATGSSNSCIQTQYKFTGIASHAAGAPEKGRSALDAVELMNIGVQFLREHMSDKARIHYAITDAGGCSPNVVQPRASVLYMVRSNHVAEAVELQKRVDKIAEGAALMTETTYEKKFIDGLADTVSNFALERVLYKNFEELGVPKYTEEENAYADALAETYDSSGVPGVAAENDENAKEQVEKMQKEYGHAMNGFLTPLYQKDAFKAGSTDVGDVSWLTPTAQIHVAAWPNGCPGHSWQNVSCGATFIGHKGVLAAGKVLAGAAIDLMESTELLAEAKAEFENKTKGGYDCPIPDGAKPVLAGEQM